MTERLVPLIWTVEEEYLTRALKDYLALKPEQRGFMLIALRHRLGNFKDHHSLAPVFIFRKGETVPIEDILKQAEGCLGADGPQPNAKIQFFTADGSEEELDFCFELLEVDGITSEPLNTVLRKYLKDSSKKK